MSRPAHRRGQRAFAATVVALLAIACSGNGSPKVVDDPTPCETPRAAADPSVPSEFPLDRLATITHVREQRRFLGIEAVSGSSIVELYPQLARSLLDEGFQILSGDNEGFEAEIFFARGNQATGTYILVEGPCEDLITIRLLVNETSKAGNS